MKTTHHNSFRIFPILLLLLLPASFLQAQVGVNRQPVNTTFVVGNDTLFPSDTVVTVLDDSNRTLLQIDRLGSVKMPRIDTSGSSNRFLTQEGDGTLVTRYLDPASLNDSDWVVTPAMIQDIDAHVSINRGVTTSPSIMINKPGIFSFGEIFLEGTTTHTPNDYFRILSGTSANNYLYPMLQGHVEGGNSYTLGLSGETTAALDTGSTPMVVFDARRTNDRIYNRPLFQWTSRFTSWMTMTADGWLGIGTTTPSVQLEITGDAKKQGGGPWLATSDRRLKQNIRDFEDGLEVLMQIRPVWFEYNGKAYTPTGKEHVGVIAQEMQDIAAYTISHFEYESKDGDTERYLEYDGNATTYILINSIQEQQAIIESQAAHIADLEASIRGIQERLGMEKGENSKAVEANQFAEK